MLVCVIFRKMLNRIKKVLSCIFLFLLLSTPLRGEEKKACWKESLFADSPRLEYLKQELAKRYSTYKLVDSAPEKIANPILFRDALLFQLNELEIAKSEFFILKEISEILRLIKQKEKEIQLLEEEKKHFRRIGLFQSDIDPQANLWLAKEKERREKEIEKRKEERRFYLEWWQDKLKSNDPLILQEIAAAPSNIFADIKTGFETEIIRKKEEYLEWENRYFSQQKIKYPNLLYYISLSSSLPHVFFYFPLPRSRDAEIYDLLYEQDKIELDLAHLTHLFAQERIYLNLYYNLKKKEHLETLLDKIEGARKLYSSFEDISSVEKIFLEASFSLERLNYERSSLKEDLLRYGPPPERERKPHFFIPALKPLLKYAEENSLLLKSREKETATINKLVTLYNGLIQSYLSSLAAYRNLLYEEEKTALVQETFRNWARLSLASRRYALQKENRAWAEELYQLVSHSSSRTSLEKKMKEIELQNQEILLLEKEKELALNFLSLKQAIKAADPENALNYLPAEKDALPDFDLNASLVKSVSVQADLKTKKKDACRKLMEQELRLLAGGEGRILLSQKESVLSGDVELAFTLEVTAKIPRDIFKPQAVGAANNFFSLKQKLLGEQEEKERSIDSLLLKESEKRIASWRQRISEEEILLKEFKKGIFLDSHERYLNQKMRIWNIKNKLLEVGEIYLDDLLALQTTREPSLSPAQENTLLKELSPVLNAERLTLLNLVKIAQADLAGAEVFFALQGLGERKEKLLELGRAFEKFLNIFSLKEKVGLTLPEDLSEMRLLQDALEEEFFHLERRRLSLRKKEIADQAPLQLDPAVIDAFREKYSPRWEKEIVAQSPSLKAAELELRKFSSAADYSFLVYLQKEKESQLCETLRLLLKNLDAQNRILETVKEARKTLADQLQLAFDGLKEERLWLYGAYGFNAIFLNYAEGEKRLYETMESIGFARAKLWQFLKFAKPFNSQSVIPVQFISKLKNFWFFLKEKSIYFPLADRERSRRRQQYKVKNYRQKLHALNFFLEEKEKEKKLKISRDLFRAAHDKEFKTTQYLDKLWDKEKEFRENIKKNIRAAGIDIGEEISLLAKTMDLEERDSEVLALFFIRYGRRLRREDFLKKHIEDIASLIKTFPVSEEEADNLPSWWAKYISPVLPYPEKTYLEEIIDLRLLGLYLYYAQLGQYLKDDVRESLAQRIQKDRPFLFLALDRIPLDKVEEYLAWEAEVRKELDKIALARWSREEWEEKRRRFARQAKNLFGALYGSSKDRVLQEEVLAWLVSSGVKETDYPDFFSLMEAVAKKIKKFFPPLSREEKLSLNEAVRLRWLFSIPENALIEEEEKKLEEATFLGNLLSWSNFFWMERITLAEIDLFFHFMERLRNEPPFKEIFGQHIPLKPAQRNFYVSSLSYWAENWLKFYRKDPLQAETNLKQCLARFRFIYCLPPFQKLYGPFDLSQVSLESGRERKALREFMGKLGFFVDWMQNFSLAEEEMETFFTDLLSLVSHKDILESFYKNQGIVLNLAWKEPQEKEEALGILINWLQFLRYRGIKGEAGLISAFREIEFIQKKSRQYELRFNTDEIRYWWEKSRLKGYEFKTVEKIFENISLVKQLLTQACQDLIRQINSSPFFSWETPSIRKEFIAFLKDRAVSGLERAEIHNLAERIMPALDIDFAELKREYAEKIYLEAAYSVFKKEKASYQMIIQFHTIMKERGYSLEEMGGFIYLYSLFRKDEGLKNTGASELEIFGLLNHLFTQPPPYEKRFLSWLDKANILQTYFLKEHQRPIDFSLLKILMNYTLLRMHPWQIRRLVEEGALSRNSPDREIRKVNPEEDFRRFILRLFWENLGEIIPEEDILRFHRISRQSGLDEQASRTAFKQLSERLSFFHHRLAIIVGQIFYEKGLSCEEIFLNSEKIIRETEKRVLPYLLRHILSKRELFYEERREKFLSLRRTHPLMSRKLPSIPFENRTSIEKALIEKASRTYGVILPPHKSASLVWKVLEGLDIEETLKIYIEDLGRIERLYRETFGKETLDFEDTQLISYFAEEINLGPLNEVFLQELFSLCAGIKNSFQQNLGKAISVQDALDYAWPSLYSGATGEALEEIFIQAKFICAHLKKIAPSDESDGQLLQDILYILSQTYGIQLVEKTDRPYNIEQYIRALEEALAYLKIDKREINPKRIKDAAGNQKVLLQPPVTFLFMAKRAEYLHRFVRENLRREIPRKEILFYLDLLQKEGLNFLNLKDISYSPLPSKVIVQKIKDALALAFRNFIEHNLSFD